MFSFTDIIIVASDKYLLNLSVATVKKQGRNKKESGQNLDCWAEERVVCEEINTFQRAITS